MLAAWPDPCGSEDCKAPRLSAIIAMLSERTYSNVKSFDICSLRLGLPLDLLFNESLSAMTSSDQTDIILDRAALR